MSTFKPDEEHEESKDSDEAAKTFLNALRK